jgi:DNA repair exonuclease SbcCD ATPase subunit
VFVGEVGAMKWTRLKGLWIENFGPFVGKHEVQFPDSGLTLIRGVVTETGDGSGAGKSSLLNSLSFLFGGCPFAATEIQSWYTDEEPRAEAQLETEAGEVLVTRHKGLTVKSPKHPKGIRGKAAEAYLDEVFGMNEKVRALCTYRGQKKPGVFLSMSDAQKKTFLSDLLDLGRYEKIAFEAAEKAKTIQNQVTSSRAKLEVAQEALKLAQERLSTAQAPDPSETDKLKASVSLCDSRAIELESAAAVEQKLAQDVRVRLTANMEAEITILRLAAERVETKGNPEIPRLEQELEALKVEIEIIKESDRLAQLQIEKQRSKLNEKLVRLRASVSDLPRLQKQLLNIQEQKVALEAQICPTCTRTWVCDESKWLLEENVQKEVQTKSEIEIKEQETQEGLKVKDELAKIPVFEPTRQLATKIQASKDLSTKIVSMRQSEQDEANKIRKANRAQEDYTRSLFALEILNQSNGHTQKTEELLKLAREQRDQARSIEKQIAINNQKLVDYTRLREDAELAGVSVGVCQNMLDQNLKDLNLELDVQAMVGREGFLGVIFEDILVEISAATNEILERVANVRHLTFQFEATKELKTGNVAQRITPVINSHGRRVSFDAGISGGMQTSVELAVDLGVAEVIARRRGTYPGFLILDEPFEGLGGISKEAAMQMLEAYSRDRLVLIVDHSSEFQGLFQQIIEIEQTDGRSSIRS